MSEDKSDKKINIHNLTMGDKVRPPKPKPKYFSVNEDTVEQPRGLLSVLMDDTREDCSAKEDVAMYLSSYDEVEVEEGLKKYAYGVNTTPVLAESCLEALCMISRRKKKLASFIEDCKLAIEQSGMDDETIEHLEDYISFATKKL